MKPTVSAETARRRVIDASDEAGAAAIAWAAVVSPSDGKSLLELAIPTSAVEIDRGRREVVGHLWDAIELSDIADPILRSVIARLGAQARARLGDHDGAELRIAAALAHAQDGHDLEAFTDALYIRAWIAERAGDLRRAAEAADVALTFASDTGQNRREVDALNAAGHYAHQLGQLELARHRCTTALELAKARGLRKAALAARSSLAEIALTAGESNRASAMLAAVESDLIAAGELYHLDHVRGLRQAAALANTQQIPASTDY